MASLAEAIGERRLAHLVTVGGGPHVTVVEVRLDGDRLALAGVGSRSTANLRENPAVTLLWQPPAEGERGLIVDGTAEVAGDTVSVTPTKAILHRPALDEAGIPAGSDCLTVDL